MAEFDVRKWLRTLRLEEYADKLRSNGYRSFEDLLDLTEDDIKQLGIRYSSKRHQLLEAVEKLRTQGREAATQEVQHLYLQDVASHSKGVGEAIPDAHVPTVPTSNTQKVLQNSLEKAPVKAPVERIVKNQGGKVPFKEYVAKEYMFWKVEDDLYIKTDSNLGEYKTKDLKYPKSEKDPLEKWRE